MRIILKEIIIFIIFQLKKSGNVASQITWDNKIQRDNSHWETRDSKIHQMQITQQQGAQNIGNMLLYVTQGSCLSYLHEN